jgi:hypothetical protein
MKNIYLYLFYRPKSIKIVYDGRIYQTPTNIIQNPVIDDTSKVQTIEMREINEENRYYIEKGTNEVTYSWKNVNVQVAEKKEGLRNMFDKNVKPLKQILNNGKKLLNYF